MLSDDAHVYPEIALPPVAGAVQETVSASAAVDTVGAAGVAGTVVAVIEFEADEARELPDAFVATTVNVYAVFDCKPATVIGDEDPVPVNEPGEDVTVNEVAVAPAPAVNSTLAAPLLNGRLVPTSVAVTLVGMPGAPLAEEPITPKISIMQYLPLRTKHLSLHRLQLLKSILHEALALQLLLL